MKKLILAILLLISLLVSNKPTFAEQQSNIPLGMELIYPENQNQNVKGYFDLAVTPNQTQTLKVIFTNQQPKSQEIIIKTANAYTDSKGGIFYEPTYHSDDAKTLKENFSMNNQIKAPTTVTVPALSKKQVEFEVTAPNISKGTILGAILFVIPSNETKKDTATEKGRAKFILRQQFIYTVAIQLDFPSKDTPNITFGNAGFNSKSGNVFLEVTNKAYLVQKDVSGKYQLKDNSGNTIHSESFQIEKMAPRTYIRHPMSWGNAALKAGNYSVAVTAKVGNDTKTFTRNFQVKGEQIKKYEAQNPAKLKVVQTVPNWIWIIAIIGVGLVMFLLGNRRNININRNKKRE